MKDIMDTWGEQEMEYTTFQGHGIEIRTSDSVDYIDIRNRSISIPHGLNVGEARRKVQEKLGKPYRAWAREGQECMVYKNSEEAIDVQFCSESERIVRILWRAFRAP